jgi:hypothetical protein
VRPHILLGALVETLPLLLGLLALVLCVVLAPNRLGADFLDASVQIIPFLLLALALETRLLSITVGPRWRARTREAPESGLERVLLHMIRFNRKLAAIYAVGMLVWAETAGLLALNGSHEGSSLGPFLLGAIVAGMVTVGVAALLPRR